MKISPKGLEFIKSFEELRLVAYKCPAGVLTIGYGHTGADVHEGQVISQETANLRLISDADDAEGAVERLVKVPLQQHEYDALVSFVFNVGVGNFASSTLLKLLNVGNRGAAASELPRWNKSNKKVLPGLTRRRLAEKAMFLDGVYP